MPKIHSLLAVAALSFVSLAPLTASGRPALVFPGRHEHHCQSNADCGDLQFCDVETSTTSCGGRGVCRPRGMNLMCMMTDVEACGCDGKPYANACIAHKAGVAVDAYPFKDTAIDGDTLAEQPWMDATQSYFYLFTGNGTEDNTSGTFEVRFEPACTRSTPRCMIAAAPRTGSFFTFGSFIELAFDDGDVAFFDAQRDCHNTWKLVAEDAAATTLTVSTILP